MPAPFVAGCTCDFCRLNEEDKPSFIPHFSPNSLLPADALPIPTDTKYEQKKGSSKRNEGIACGMHEGLACIGLTGCLLL